MRKPIHSLYRLVDQLLHTLSGFEEVTFSGQDGLAINIPHYSQDYTALFHVFHQMGLMGIPIYHVLPKNWNMGAYQLCFACIKAYTYFRMRVGDMTNEQMGFILTMITRDLQLIVDKMDTELQTRIPSEKIKTHFSLGCWKTDCDNEDHMRYEAPGHHELLQPLFDYIAFLDETKLSLSGVSE